MTRTVALIAVCIVVLAGAVHAQPPPPDDREFEKFLDTGLQGVALAVPVVRLMAHDPVKRETGRRVLDAALFASTITEALKQTINSPRPSGGPRGFPSGHTSLAFAVATSLFEREPKTGWIAFPVAAAVGWMRVDLGAHTWWQVAAGAALGAYAGHMCGEGKWRLFGHRDSALAPQAASALLPEPTWETPVDRSVSSGFVMTQTLWSTRF